MPAALAEAPMRAPATGGSPFAAVIDSVLGGANASRAASEAAIHDLATGRTDNLHDVMLQVAQADLSFRLVLEIRNRLTDAYQEVMKMQI
jgi:flagellar hook-basal body complex protein FliE